MYADYLEDPATRYLVQEKRVVIRDHETIWKIIHTVFEKRGGQRDSEILDAYHYTTHLKVGAAKIYLEDLQSLYDVDLVSQSSMYPVVYKLQLVLESFFANLVGAIDSLCQEVNVAFNLQLRGRLGFWSMKDKTKKLSISDTCLSSVFNLFDNSEVVECVRTVCKYRNSLIHRHLKPYCAIFIQGTDAISMRGTLEELEAYTSAGLSIPRPVAYGIFQRSLRRRLTAEDIDPSRLLVVWTHGPLVFFPKAENLDKLPTELLQFDFDDTDVKEVCELLYDKILSFIERTYQPLLKHIETCLAF